MTPWPPVFFPIIRPSLLCPGAAGPHHSQQGQTQTHRLLSTWFYKMWARI